MVSTSPADAKKDKPSFAKIAAAGIKPPNAQQHAPTSPSNPNQKHDDDDALPSSPPPDGAPVVAPSTSQTAAGAGPRHKKLVQLASNDMKHTKEPVEMGPNGPEVRVQIVESVPQRPREPAPEGSLMPSSDDVGTQVSSSSGSNKPQSLDGKSDVASGTTFALDEKDSLRPDDSASVKAVDEEDMFSPPGSGVPGSRIGSDDGVRAFRDQLREISSMEPQRRGPPPIFGHTPQKGVLYVPPQGPGIGSVPSAHRAGPPVPEPVVDIAPDQKLLDALENPRDRVWVLKLEQDVIDFVKDPKESSLTLPQCHAFYRLLAHKMADYYMLGHLVDDTSAAVRLYKTPDCRIPPPLTGITQPSTAASTPPPSAQPMKILKRGAGGPAIANGSNMPSKSGSENGDSGDEKKKGPITREEREARYEAARLRIMGSAKPTESPETTKEKQESRPSSTTGKKNRKKARADSDDGFDPRSAYSNFYTPTYGSDGVTTPSYGYQGYSESGNNPFPSAYAPQGGSTMQQMQMQQGTSNANWNQQAYQHVDPTQAWAQGQSSGYDLSADFQRSMTFQNQMPAQSPTVGYNANFGPQYNYGGQQQGWSQQQQQPPQQQYQTQPQVTQPGYGYGSTYTPTAGQSQQDASYAFGQLPSQAFPGRPPSKTEHPLPGSYKSKHFNPQSQSFVPGQTNGSPFSPHAVPAGFHQGYGPQPPQRQNSTQSQGSAFGSPHHLNSPNMMQNRTPLTHPLPQPVYPRQPSPSLPLPPKPGSAQHRPNEHAPPIPPPATTLPPQQQPQHPQSLLAKWGAPASLPAKPPPSADSFDAMKFKQIQQQSFVGPAAANSARTGLPAFGTMPPGGGSQIVNGSGAKRG
ncbi:hypothetical protein PRZ48_012166 [Zasmidium cellare]|uniref:R3H domain-containing protein 2 n=1 Tax=Zasmidium cellare TaxID=395010 RepID=A0ABR0E430_ZASCE|nr:hypothetical protein PRZ48_012166 [Zasmidium cellare]